MSDFENYGGEGFYDSGYSQAGYEQSGYDQGGYDQSNYGYGSPQQGYYGAGYDQSYNQQTYTPQPTMMNPNQYVNYNGDGRHTAQNEYASFDDEPPLLEELGINFDHIGQKTLSVLNPWQMYDSNIMDDTDLAGPLVFCLAFGGFLLLSGKVHGFGYIYGVGVLGCMAMYAVLNLMSLTGVTLTCVVSVLGYCLLPMVLLSGISVLLTLQGSLGTLLTFIVIAWCSFSASKLFVTVLAMNSQQPLVMYPCGLLYGVFALLTVF